MLRRPIARVRERMVLGQVRPLLEADEHVAAWAHVQAPGGEQPGLISLTPDRCLVHWSARQEATAIIRWDDLTRWELRRPDAAGSVLVLSAGTRSVEARLPLSNRTRARTATEVVDHVSRYAPPQAEATGNGSRSLLRAERRGVRGYARRIVVTVVGVLVLVVSALFASPFVPGPGALTFLAGLAILAREYDWARDVHHWVKRKFERVWSWLRTRRAERLRRRGAAAKASPSAGPAARAAGRSPRSGGDVHYLADVREARQAGMYGRTVDADETPDAQDA
jgi:uncharacterized protein (TIGR02611 family)